jgi:hypothetical protein
MLVAVASVEAVGCTLLSGVDNYHLVDHPPGFDGSLAPTDPPTPPGQDPGPSPDPGNTGTDGGHVPEAGGKAKRVFVTSEQWAGNLGGLGGADNLCKQAAESAGLGNVEWRAWLSTKDTNAVTRLEYLGPYALLNGSLIANSPADLIAGPKSPINWTEKKAAATTDPAQAAVWTGTDSNGVAMTNNCAGWILSAFYSAGYVGSLLSVGTTWTYAAGRQCSQPAHLYCFEL